MNPKAKRLAYQLIYAGHDTDPTNFTSEVPINADVWLAYCDSGFSRPCELLLTPHTAANIADLRRAVLSLLPGLRPAAAGTVADNPDRCLVASNESYVLARLRIEQLLQLLPLTDWFERMIAKPLVGDGDAKPSNLVAAVARALGASRFAAWLAAEIDRRVSDEQALRQFKQIGLDAAAQPRFAKCSIAQRGAVRRLVNVAGLYVALRQLDGQGPSSSGDTVSGRRGVQLCQQVLAVATQALLQSTSRRQAGAVGAVHPLWRVSLNRPARHAVMVSRKTVKADAAIRVFDVGGQGVRWAVVDSGIDASHPAFARLERLRREHVDGAQRVDPTVSRVVRTLDFTRLAAITSGCVTEALAAKLAGVLSRQELLKRVAQIEQALTDGQMLDWRTIEPLLEIRHDGVAPYEVPVDGHGTHVAGIIGANWRRDTYERLVDGSGAALPAPVELIDADVIGVSPQIELLDLRVFDPARSMLDDGADEFAILAALQYVRYLNQSKDRQYVHGVNLSLSLRHDVRSYGCGSTPVCMECERLVGSGVVVVAAAGNDGYDRDYAAGHLGGAYRGQSITDPGNSPSVITVGATHRTDPYQYGISYFSSHGPTGDGRNKPDLVAPGEKVVSTTPSVGLASKDGTSMAAPHVSGIAALLLSRYTELMGQPLRVKDLLCRSALDLGRDRVFQGYGLVDALRALQSV